MPSPAPLTARPRARRGTGSGARDGTSAYLASFLVSGLCISMLGPALSELRDRAGASTGAIGSLFAAQSFGYLVGASVLGRRYDRGAPHRTYAMAMVGLAAVMTAVPLGASLVALNVLFVLMGVAAGLISIGGNTMLIWTHGSEVGPRMAALHLAFGVGALSSPLLVRLGLWVVCLAGAAGAGAVALLLGRRPEPASPTAAGDDRVAPPRRHLLLVAGFFVLYVGLEIGFSGWLYTFAIDAGLAGATASWLVAAFWAAFTTGRLLGALSARRVDPRRTLTAALALTVAGAAGLAAMWGNTAAAFAATVCIALGLAPQFPTMITLAERHLPMTASTGSWFLAGSGVGSLTLPFLAGLWFDRVGATALPMVSVVAASATLVWFVTVSRALIAATRRRYTPSAAS